MIKVARDEMNSTGRWRTSESSEWHDGVTQWLIVSNSPRM